MFDIREYYSQENQKARDDYKKSLTRIQEIDKNLKKIDYPGIKGEYHKFLKKISEKILYYANLEKILGENHFKDNDFETLQKENKGFYEEILEKNYEKSYANPSYCVEVFGDDFGQLLSYFYMMYRQYLTYSFYHKIFEMEELNKLYIDVYEYIINNEIDYKMLEELITEIERKDKTHERMLGYKEFFDPEFRYYNEIVEKSDLEDLRYLFKYNSYITSNEIKTAKFLQDYPEEKIDKLTSMIVKAYKRGFVREGKSLENKSTVSLMFNAGMERIIRSLIDKLAEMGLKASISRVNSTPANKQYNYDHRFDISLFLNEQYVEKAKGEVEEAAKQVKGLMANCSGIVFFSKFGEQPFKPEHKDKTLKLDDEQQTLYRIHQNNQMRIQNKYYPREKTSFTAISFPSPEIGDDFEEIFEDVLEINMLDSKTYEGIQQKIIDALDLADHVHVKGKNDNETNIKVNMHTLEDPARQTNFLNCGADVNIPVGEVFTSPKLKGTNGLLHIKKTYLAGLKFEDLKIEFENGYIKDYSCSNFDDEEQNKKYVHENLLLPHKTLPIGEFAIGTNTLAYVTSRKHDILDVLPVLIIEKMGPHFAIGDTCFTFEEDKPVFNPDDKEIVARENERTALRKENPNKAYTFKHIDITLPYDSIDHISVITKCGRDVDIIRDGKFVLSGTEKLNEPLENR